MGFSGTKTIQQDAGGIFAEFYTDDDGGSGYGDNPRVARWYGTLEECKAVTSDQVQFHPLPSWDSRTDPFDLACERRSD